MSKTTDEYVYIGTFIDFLQRIIDMIVNLFSSLTAKAE